MFYSRVMPRIIKALNRGMFMGGDDVTGVVKRVGRPSSGSALDNAARSKAKRDRLEADGKKQVSVTISIEVLEAIKKHVQFKDLTLGDAFDKALRDRFLRKR